MMVSSFLPPFEPVLDRADAGGDDLGEMVALLDRVKGLQPLDRRLLAVEAEQQLVALEDAALEPVQADQVGVLAVRLGAENDLDLIDLVGAAVLRKRAARSPGAKRLAELTGAPFDLQGYTGRPAVVERAGGVGCGAGGRRVGRPRLELLAHGDGLDLALDQGAGAGSGLGRDEHRAAAAAILAIGRAAVAGLGLGEALAGVAALAAVHQLLGLLRRLAAGELVLLALAVGAGRLGLPGSSRRLGAWRARAWRAWHAAHLLGLLLLLLAELLGRWRHLVVGGLDVLGADVGEDAGGARLMRELLHRLLLAHQALLVAGEDGAGLALGHLGFVLVGQLPERSELPVELVGQLDALGLRHHAQQPVE